MKLKNLQQLGGLSAFYLALSYLLGIAIFIFALDYLNIVEPSQKMDVLVNHQSLIILTNLIMYVVFGFFLLLLNLALYERFKERTPLLAQIATAMGIIWAGALILSGMVANAGVVPAVALFHENPAQGIVYWSGIESVANGLGGADGEYLGGIMTLFFGIAGLKGGTLPKWLNYYGILVGAIGIISTIPGLKDLVSLFGMSQIIWFIGIGVCLIRNIPQHTLMSMDNLPYTSKRTDS